MQTRCILLFMLLAMMLGILGSPAGAAPSSKVVPQTSDHERIYLPLVRVDPLPTVRVRDYRSQIWGSSSNGQIIGEVINELAHPVYYVEVAVIFRNAQGQEIGRTVGDAFLERLNPGQRSPFLLQIEQPLGTASHDVQVTDWDTTSEFLIEPLEVVSQQAYDNAAEVFGEVRNPTPYDIVDGFAVVTLYDEAGKVLNVAYAFIHRWNLPSGEASLYKMIPNGGAPYAHYTVQAEGYAAEPAPRLNLQVLSHREFVEYPKREIVGEIINNSALPAYDVLIEAKLFDANNRLIAVNFVTYAQLDQTRPGQRNTFLVGLSGPYTTGSGVRYELRVSGYPDSLLDYRPLTVVSRSVKQQYYGLEVTGSLRNDQKVTLLEPRVAVTFYDAAGKVVDVGQGGALVDTIAAGAQGGYSLIATHKMPYASYTVQAQGYVKPAQVFAQQLEPSQDQDQREPEHAHTRHMVDRLIR